MRLLLHFPFEFLWDRAWPVSSSKIRGWCRKKRAKRKAVSAVTARSPLTIAPTRVPGTRRAIAKALTDIRSGLRNSSFSTSPGWAVTRLGVAMALVVIDDFDIGWSFFGPEAMRY